MSKKKKKTPKVKDASKLMEDSFGLDSHLKPKVSDLGDEDLGEGTYAKKVRIERDAKGNIVNLKDIDSPMSAFEEKIAQDMYKKILEQPPVMKKPKSERGMVIHMLAKRLFDDYVSNIKNQSRPNPLRDGIPGCGCGKSNIGCVNICPDDKIKGRIYDGSPQTVYDWLVAMVSNRANIYDSRNKK
jgi:hypothetical protein